MMFVSGNFIINSPHIALYRYYLIEYSDVGEHVVA